MKAKNIELIKVSVMELKYCLPCKVVVCGDSISAGVCFDEKENKYIKLKDNFVGLLQSSLNCVVTNISRFGNTVTTALPKLNRNMDKEKPDIVLIELGGNDCDYKWEQVAENPQGEHNPITDIEVFESSLVNLVDGLRSKDIEPVMMTLPPIDADKYFQWISKSNADTGSKILEWLGSVTRIYWWHEKYNAAVLKVVENSRSSCIDVRSAFLNTPDFRRLICKDGIHPNQEGQRLISDTIYKYLHTNYPVLLKPATV
ncbi:MAG: SGNH/GDSL hydrolase family protein [Clostridia bacterium]|nr:SGNH/GDSL hydrolase family protein [Clostridia bacterium]MDR3644310.1 SGNH/GDSL hydrolase family protein [Clostridia bacterium]